MNTQKARDKKKYGGKPILRKMTLVLHLVEGRIVGIFEHHTGEINRAQLEDMLEKLARGTLTNEEVFNTSGHGALILNSPSN